MAGATTKTVALVAVEPVEHDHTRYEPGDAFKADAVAAEALLASGAATKTPKSKAQAEDKPEAAAASAEQPAS